MRIEDTLMATVNAAGLNSVTSPLYVQSFEPTSLQYMRSIGSKVKQVQLIDAYDVDGVFSDQADTALEARTRYLKEKGL